MRALAERPTFRPIEVTQAKPRWQLDPDLRLYLPLWNMPDGNVFLSPDAYGHTVTRTGATPTGQGGWSFDGTDDLLSVAHHAALNMTAEVTIIGWIKLDTVAPNYQSIACKTSGAAESYGFYVNLDGLYYQFNDSGYFSPAVTENFVINTWYHVAWVKNTPASISELYVGGYLTRTLTTAASGATTEITTSTAPVTIGRGTGASNHLDGWGGEVYIYSRALTPFEILANFNRTKGRFGGG